MNEANALAGGWGVGMGLGGFLGGMLVVEMKGRKEWRDETDLAMTKGKKNLNSIMSVQAC
jgi:hypothetical protein